ncbi:hypothetical protein GH714_008529 [Hevea brasiliensis]|uniref:Uncharacterized protein n=1 Tax=Hevea brasiliensis TaxID=3981 RepID=A0A6A6LRC6_HEVBR|nr:hypothetical protein GH714_008529 [Hevea brasiliensis]
MDKNKSRTDMLAAGRKKKKDNKGSSSHGKSSKMSGKSEQHESYTDAVSNASNSTALPQNSVAPDVDIVAINPFSIPLAHDTSSIDNTNMDKQGVRVHDIDSSNSNNEERIDMLAPSAIVETTDGTTVTYELESRNREREESLPSKEDTPDMFLICARGDQVTDVGTMQEVDGLGGTRVIELDGDGRLALSEHDDNAETGERVASEQTGMVDVASQVKQNDGACGESASASATEVMDGLLASTLSLSEAAGSLVGVDEVANQQSKVINVGPSNTKDAEMLSWTGQCGKNEEGSQIDRNIEALIKGLNEDEYGLLLRSRGLTDSLISLEHGRPRLKERLREELFLTSCMKDILEVQLTEQSYLQTEHDHQFQQMDNELSVLRASLDEVHERCNSLAEELMECRSELLATVSGREELQLQFNAAKAEVEEVSARAKELQNSLERSQADISNLLKESADSKGSVGALCAENENLNQTIALLTEERKKLVDKKMLVCMRMRSC